VSRNLLAVIAVTLLAAACSTSEANVPRDPRPTAGSTTTRALRVDSIPVAHTPAGGYGSKFPEPILTGCTDPIPAAAPDLRGMWRVVDVEVDGAPAHKTHPAYRHFERVEQCGDRLVVTGGGVIHDMRCNGSEEHGVHDVAQRDFTTPITVVCTYENGVHVLRPVGIPIEVTRRRDGADMIWKYVGFTARLERIGGPEAPPPSG
jgi:hypothetical protein